jgi:hypothetical protein
LSAGSIARRIAPVLGAVALMLLIAGPAKGKIPDSMGVYTGCVNVDGTLTVIDAATTTCPSGQQTITWSQTGPSGPAGAIGPQGPTGASGANALYVWTAKGKLLVPNGQQAGSVLLALGKGTWVIHIQGEIESGDEVRLFLDPLYSADGPALFQFPNWDPTRIFSTLYPIGPGDTVGSSGQWFTAGETLTLPNAGTIRLVFVSTSTAPIAVASLGVVAQRFDVVIPQVIDFTPKYGPFAPSSPALSSNASGSALEPKLSASKRTALAIAAAGGTRRLRAQIVLLASEGTPLGEVAQRAFVTPAYVQTTLRDFKRKGMAGLGR